MLSVRSAPYFAASPTLSIRLDATWVNSRLSLSILDNILYRVTRSTPDGAPTRGTSCFSIWALLSVWASLMSAPSAASERLSVPAALSAVWELLSASAPPSSWSAPAASEAISPLVLSSVTVSDLSALFVSGSSWFPEDVSALFSLSSSGSSAMVLVSVSSRSPRSRSPTS